MRISYVTYLPDQEIPVYDFVVQRKLVKYYTRETMAAMAAMAALYPDRKRDEDTPFFYATGELEMMAFYIEACQKMAGRHTRFSPELFLKELVPQISPLTQFKQMRNMTQCFVSIEYGLRGDNAALLRSGSGMLYEAMLCPGNRPVLIGAGRLYADNRVEVGFAEVLPSELEGHPLLGKDFEPVDFFRTHQPA